MKPSFSFTNLVTPAQAGVHHLPDNFQVPVMDSRLPIGQFILSGWLASQPKGGNDGVRGS
jgi:hypothetical protein